MQTNKNVLWMSENSILMVNVEQYIMRSRWKIPKICLHYLQWPIFLSKRKRKRSVFANLSRTGSFVTIELVLRWISLKTHKLFAFKYNWLGKYYNPWILDTEERISFLC